MEAKAELCFPQWTAREQIRPIPGPVEASCLHNTGKLMMLPLHVYQNILFSVMNNIEMVNATHGHEHEVLYMKPCCGRCSRSLNCPPQVGATSYSASAIYAEELKTSWTRRKRHWREVVKGEGGMLQKVRLSVR